MDGTPQETTVISTQPTAAVQPQAPTVATPQAQPSQGDPWGLINTLVNRLLPAQGQPLPSQPVAHGSTGTVAPSTAPSTDSGRGLDSNSPSAEELAQWNVEYQNHLGELRSLYADPQVVQALAQYPDVAQAIVDDPQALAEFKQLMYEQQQQYQQQPQYTRQTMSPPPIGVANHAGQAQNLVGALNAPKDYNQMLAIYNYTPDQWRSLAMLDQVG